MKIKQVLAKKVARTLTAHSQLPNQLLLVASSSFPWTTRSLALSRTQFRFFSAQVPQPDKDNADTPTIDRHSAKQETLLPSSPKVASMPGPRKLKTKENSPKSFLSVWSNVELFVDQTMFIKQFYQEASEVISITFGRRWGKTVNMQMTELFFKQHADSEGNPIDSPYRYVFEQCLIRDHMDALEFGKVPTIYLSMGEFEPDDMQSLLEGLNLRMRKLYYEHEYLLKSKRLSFGEKRDIERMIENADPDHPNKTNVRASLQNLAEYLSRHFGRQAFILIDEYDSPIVHVQTRSSPDQLMMLQFMKNFYSGPMKFSNAVEKGYLTGVTPLAMSGIISGFNNIDGYSNFNEKYATYFGFTDDVVDGLCRTAIGKMNANAISPKVGVDGTLSPLTEDQKREQLADIVEITKDLLKKIHYLFNGFYTLKDGKLLQLYNPFSVYKCFKILQRDPQDSFQNVTKPLIDSACSPKWTGTSNAKIIEQFLGNSTVTDIIYKLLRGESVVMKLSYLAETERMDFKKITLGGVWGLMKGADTDIDVIFSYIVSFAYLTSLSLSNHSELTKEDKDNLEQKNKELAIQFQRKLLEEEPESSPPTAAPGAEGSAINEPTGEVLYVSAPTNVPLKSNAAALEDYYFLRIPNLEIWKTFYSDVLYCLTVTIDTDKVMALAMHFQDLFKTKFQSIEPTLKLIEADFKSLLEDAYKDSINRMAINQSERLHHAWFYQIVSKMRIKGQASFDYNLGDSPSGVLIESDKARSGRDKGHRPDVFLVSGEQAILLELKFNCNDRNVAVKQALERKATAFKTHPGVQRILFVGFTVHNLKEKFIVEIKTVVESRPDV